MPFDPTQTVTLRRTATAAGTRAYMQVYRDLQPVLQQYSDDTNFRLFDSTDDAASVESALRDLLSRNQIDVLPDLMKAYRKGVERAYTDVRQLQMGTAPSAGRAEFVRQVMQSTEGRTTVERLHARYRFDVAGLNDYLVHQVVRSILYGTWMGDVEVAVDRAVFDRVAHKTRGRYGLVAHDMIVRAHAEGQLDAFDSLRIARVRAEVESVTAGDRRVCAFCSSVAGRLILSIDDARGRIPFHPRCRCRWVLLDSDKVSLRRRSSSSTLAATLMERNP